MGKIASMCAGAALWLAPVVLAVGVLAAEGASAAAASGRLVRDGVAIEFEARPVAGGDRLTEGGLADIRFTVTDANSGAPLKGLAPGAWLDLAQVIAGRGESQKECKDKIALYLKGVVGVRPMLDLNSYYLLVLNKDPSITVIDPLMSVAGTTSTLTRIMLKRPPMDWVKSADGRSIFVSMPSAGQVAVVDAGAFRVVKEIDAGPDPVRVALQPDGRYLWVGNNARDAAQSGVSVIDAANFAPVARFITGKGHHEIAFSSDSRFAFVTNRDAGTLSVIDNGMLEKRRDIAVGRQPISVAVSPLSQAVYVADGAAGTVTVIDAETLATRKVIAAKPGLGPVRFSADGRWGFALNTLENLAVVIDAGSDEVAHEIPVATEPYQVTFTRDYAYVRGLASEQVSMVKLGSLGKGRQPTVQGFAAGTGAPRLAGDVPLAASLAAKADDGAVFVVNPANNTTYFYMEGMNAPMAGYLNRGHQSRAVTVVDRSMQEVEPGVFATRVMIPAAGRFDVAFMLDRPQILHCFSASVATGDATEARLAATRLEFLPAAAPVAAPATVPVRFRLVAGRQDAPRTGLAELSARYFLAPASAPKKAAVREVGEGVYEALVETAEPGAYYVHIDTGALKLAAESPSYVTVRALPQGAAGGETGANAR